MLEVVPQTLEILFLEILAVFRGFSSFLRFSTRRLKWQLAGEMYTTVECASMGHNLMSTRGIVDMMTASFWVFGGFLGFLGHFGGFCSRPVFSYIYIVCKRISDSGSSLSPEGSFSARVLKSCYVSLLGAICVFSHAKLKRVFWGSCFWKM
jgi:hypothetical protein